LSVQFHGSVKEASSNKLASRNRVGEQHDIRIGDFHNSSPCIYYHFKHLKQYVTNGHPSQFRTAPMANIFSAIEGY